MHISKLYFSYSFNKFGFFLLKCCRCLIQQKKYPIKIKEIIKHKIETPKNIIPNKINLLFSNS